MLNRRLTRVRAATARQAEMAYNCRASAAADAGKFQPRMDSTSLTTSLRGYRRFISQEEAEKTEVVATALCRRELRSRLGPPRRSEAATVPPETNILQKAF